MKGTRNVETAAISRRCFSSIIIAHRGASAAAPENTQASIRQAVRAGADMVELDVQMSRDGRLVIFHDDRLERTSSGAGLLVRMSYRDLAKLDAGGWFHPRFRGERIPLLSQAIQAIPAHMLVNLELKRTRKRALLIRKLLRLIQRTRLAQRLLISSFDAQLLKALRTTCLARALICRDKPDQSLRTAIRLRCQAWHPFYKLATAYRISRAHSAGLHVYAWTVDDPRRARQLMQRGLDGIFTNNPAALRRLKL